ncbi:hypothetical protein PpBr36_08622 [Pyricularia pennisetigena]|uniref:hypothetical protein n=1 Tax=Pyricularia pennisetigena TaxID=1578925 RepID=UPI0011512EDD|nr:hypothetical protein PpBr36_08622 [Pyricularia pennisetigena]TLS24726.1 hypothetical protein PpBr36_08622 [Pyricularia pennisetigena]
MRLSMSNQTKQTISTSSALGHVDLPRLDCETPPISLHEAQRYDATAQSSRPIAALIFCLFQDLRLSHEKQKRRIDKLEEGTNSRLHNLDKTLDARQERHTAQVEEVLVHIQKCAVDIEKLSQVQNKAEGIYARDERLTSEVARLDGRLNTSEDELSHLSEAVCSCVNKQNLEVLLERKITEKLHVAEEKITQQNKTLLELSEELRRLKDEVRTQKDQTRETLGRKSSRATARKVADKPSRPEGEPEDIYTAETQPLEPPILKTHYNLRPRSQPSVEQPAMPLAVSALPSTSPIAPSKSRQGTKKKSRGGRTTNKTVGAQKRTAAASDADNILDHLPSSKRRKQPNPQTNLSRVCCEAQWAYEKCPEEKSEQEFITDFLKFSVKGLSSAEKKRLMEALRGLAIPDNYGMPVFRQDADWSDIWEHLWTIKNVPAMYLKEAK